jgi:lipoate-protein ligase A
MEVARLAGKWSASMHGEYKMPGGKLVVIDLEVVAGRLAQVQLSGDFFLEPDSALGAINAALEGQSASCDEAALAALVQAATGTQVTMYGISPEAIAVAVRRALHEGAGA